MNEEYTVAYICLLICGIMQMICFFILFHFVKKSKQWPTTKGKILYSGITFYGLDDENSNRVYKAVVRYQYQVMDKIYISERLYYGDWITTNFSSRARKLAKQYILGSECNVYYNPLNPRKSVLKTNLNASVCGMLVSGIIFILFASALFVFL